ncbi:MAG: RNA-binding S4 domain-containing protein [Alicyclobacillus sp.]|nr:RNA-binding S4 domain-containing protein [Alicyclobacillus sp.]
MRLDKFLKVSRLVKRRTVAKELADAGRVDINGRPAKAATEVHLGDVVTLHFGNRTLVVRVAQLLDNPRKEMATNMYEVVQAGVGAPPPTTEDPSDGPAVR